MLVPPTNRHLNVLAHSAQVAGFFEPSIRSIVTSIEDDFSRRLARGSVRTSSSPSLNSLMIREQTAFLVGGFAASGWLSRELEERLSKLGLRMCKPDTHT